MRNLNKRFLSLTCLMLVLLSACVDDPELSEQGEVMLKLRVSFANPQLSTRAIEDYYFHNEYTVSRLDVYFFDVETKKFFTKAVITNLTKDDSTYDTEYDITYQFDNIRIRAGVYDIFTIANYDYAPDKVADETELLDRIDSLTYREGIEASIPATGPVMTNRATSMLAVDLIPMINKTYILNIELERVMAKLQIGVSQTVEYEQAVLSLPAYRYLVGADRRNARTIYDAR